MVDEDELTGVTDEDRVVMEVEEYASRASGLKYSPTIQTRRVIKALRLIGLKRSEFRARTEVDRRTGEYGTAIGSPYERPGAAVIIKNAALLRRCGLTVHVINSDPDCPSAFVSTPTYGEARIINYASVSSRT